jgi:hypothetical protein
MGDPLNWDDCIQVMTDFLTTPNGKIANNSNLEEFEEHIPVYSVSDDVSYQDRFRLPRIV